MDDKEVLSFTKLKAPLKRSRLKEFRNRMLGMKKFFYITTIIIILILICTIIILFFQNKKLNNKLSDKKNNLIYTKEGPQIIARLFNYKEDKIEDNNKNLIHIAYSLDNKLVFPTFVSMVSGLENNNKNENIIIYHLLLSYDFDTANNIEIFESLKSNYEVKINYYIIPQIFTNIKKWTSGTECIYYKVLIPLMFPDLERMIHLDGDTLIRKDVWEMYNYHFDDNYILGFPFYMPYVMDPFGINATHYITVGCILFNIKKICKDRKDVDLLQLTIKNNSKLRFPEQDAINYIFYPKVGFLPLKYGIYMIGNHPTFKSIARYTRSYLNLTEGYEAVDDPSIIHFSCCWPKIWENGTKNLFRDKDICLRYQKEFYDYAKKTKYYSVIYKTLFYPSNKK